MAILADENTRVIVQGITGREGSFHTKLMLEYGTKIVAGVTPGKGGMEVHGVPVYDTVEEALEEHPDANASIVFVPARFAPDAVYEAIDAGLKLVVVITEHIPVHETMRFVNYARQRGTVIIGPNCPGIISPGKTKIGIMPGRVFTPGPVGIVSRSGTLTYEIAYALTRSGIGQSTVVGIGGDPIVGLSFTEAMELFERDPETKVLVLIGEIGGDMEERAARMIEEGRFTKPVVAFIAGRTAPPGKRMGHAGAIIMMGTGRYEDKVRALEKAGARVARSLSEIPRLVKEALEKA
ncbi:succinate--CoA ligase subunit alpha [Hyperthermus butylicus]|uniref:Succinate--CoA ligase [ADP-forming] subunit alpha n=1 Tax=Hyperthermus butylicus (strain DSM 5456 / JCM 9403 / PLM1-5) TaxID=415426 RepID=A2BJB3_HYPBU|nr:succinate--CoA ligase subunit alpha [Hyperthermus butylicus]ABM80074.1 Succinyl-CoA synthetase alpha chain [Hyperthermus butylicus DSM 5456]